MLWYPMLALGENVMPIQEFQVGSTGRCEYLNLLHHFLLSLSSGSELIFPTKDNLPLPFSDSLGSGVPHN